MFSVQIDYWKHLENRRNNLAQVEELNRSNKEREYETRRHNVEEELAKSRSLNLQANQLLETIRSNKAQEDIKRAGLAETERSNVSQEDIKRAGNTIQSDYYSGLLDYNQGRLAEDHRANVVHEEQTQYLLPSQRFLNYTSGARNITSAIGDVGNLVLDVIKLPSQTFKSYADGFANVLRSSQ